MDLVVGTGRRLTALRGFADSVECWGFHGGGYTVTGESGSFTRLFGWQHARDEMQYRTGRTGRTDRTDRQDNQDRDTQNTQDTQERAGTHAATEAEEAVYLGPRTV